MMKRIVQNFGPDLHGLKEKVPEAEFCLNAKRHSISIIGTTKELKQTLEDVIHDLAQKSGSQNLRNENDVSCLICLCDVEDSYKLEDCSHEFCRLCLVEQCESAITSQDSIIVQ